MAELTMSTLMRKKKSVLLSLASGIEFINDSNTKSEIAEALLIMQDDRGNVPLLDPMGSPTAASETGATPRSPAPGDVDYPKSLRVRRIEASKQNS